MSILRSKNRKLAKADGKNDAGSRGFKLGFRKIFGVFGKYVSCMFATAEPKRTYIDVYSRPTFNKSLVADPGRGYSSADLGYAEKVRCGSFKTAGVKRFEYRAFDHDSWSDDEIREYDSKFIAVQLNDEVVDMMKMSIAGIEEDAIEMDDFGYYSEADITYEEIEIPEVRPGFLPEVIKEAPAEETPVFEELPVEVPLTEEIETPAEEIPVEVPATEVTEAPAVEEMPVEVPVIIQIEDSVVEEPVELELEAEEPKEVEIEVQPMAIEAPAVAGLLAEAKEETVEIVEQPVVEAVPETPVVEAAVPEVVVAVEPEAVVEEPRTSMFSFGFGTASVAPSGLVAFSFGFGAKEEKAEESSFIANSMLVSSDAVGQKA